LSGSTDIGAQELAAPVAAAWLRSQATAPGWLGESGSGSNAHFCAPVIASYARMTPRSTSVARLSPTDEPTTTTLFTTTGGEVTV
jgi:hypothetical protein